MIWATFAAGAAVVVLVVVLLILLFGWEQMNLGQRLGLAMSAAGLVLAGPDRWLQKPPGLGDMLFLAGLLLYLVATHGTYIVRRVDLLDGREDGRLTIWRNQD